MAAEGRIPLGLQRSSLSWLLALALLASGLGGLAYWRSSRVVRVSEQRAQEALMRGLGLGLVDPLVARDYGALEARLQQAMADETLQSTLLRDASGRVLAHLSRAMPGGQPELVLSPSGGQPQLAKGLSSSSLVIRAGVPVGQLEVRRWTSPTEALLRDLALQITLLTAMALLLFVAVLVMLVLGQRQRMRRHQQRLESVNRDLERVAALDPLTGVANRRGFELALDQVLQRYRQGSLPTAVLAMVDLDGFKPINDNLGHHAGDALLKEIARRLGQAVRASDLVARLGGDEFVLLLTSAADQDTIAAVFNRVQLSIRHPMTFEGNVMRVSASIGVARVGPGRDEAQTLVQAADQAMYRAKRSGKDRWCLATDGPEGSAPVAAARTDV